MSFQLNHQPLAGNVCGVTAAGSEWIVSMHGSAVYAVKLNGVWYAAEVLASDLLDEIEAAFKVAA